MSAARLAVSRAVRCELAPVAARLGAATIPIGAALLALLGAATGAGCASRAEPHAPATPARAEAGARVDVRVDFGPAGRAPIECLVRLPAGASAVDALRAVAGVEQDRLCCSADDVWSVAGVGPDARQDRYWFWRVGGKSGDVAASAYRVREGDRIEWRYAAIGGVDREAGAPGDVRVVSLLPAATEILAAIGAEGSLVGASHLCRLPAGRDVPRVLSSSIDGERWDMRAIDAEVRRASAAHEPIYALDRERLAELRPDLVIAQGLCPVCAATPADVERWTEHAGGSCPTVLSLTPRSLADVAADIERVGQAVGRLGASRVARREFERRIEAVRARGDGSGRGERPGVVVLEWFEPLWVSGEWIAEMVEVAGGSPLLAAPGEGSRPIEWEDLARADPDVIVLAPCAMSIERARREVGWLTRREGWSALRAVRAGAVYLVDGATSFSAPGPGLASGCEVLEDVLRDARREGGGREERGEGWVRAPAR